MQHSLKSGSTNYQRPFYSGKSTWYRPLLKGMVLMVKVPNVENYVIWGIHFLIKCSFSFFLNLESFTDNNV